MLVNNVLVGLYKCLVLSSFVVVFLITSGTKL